MHTRSRVISRLLRVALPLCVVALASPALATEPAPASVPSPNVVRVAHDEGGFRLVVDGRDFMVFGMNWGYIPIGENYGYDLWKRPDDFIRAALDEEMPMLQRMGINAIRQYPGIPPRWVTYIYEKYGIYTIINHTTGRYGFEVDGAFVSPVDYSDAAFRAAVRADVKAVVARYKDTPGVLMWLLGNENNYGLEWSSYEIEALPRGERQQAKAVFLYSLWGDLVGDIKALDTTKPVAIANGDVQYIDLIAEHVKGLDIMGANVYRGASGRDLFQVVKDKLDLPFMYTEVGSDAYDALREREDQLAQARIEKAQWQEIYEMSAGKGRVGNAIGGLIFQWSDGWWKYLQETRLDVHDTHASWANEAYPFDYEKGRDNMNEEWFGICAKGPRDETGHFPVYPRAAYYVLQAGFRLDPYAPGTTLDAIRRHWGNLRAEDFTAPYERARLDGRVALLERFRINALRLDLETFYTGGSHLTDPARARDRFDHLESVYVDFGFQPTSHLSGNLSLNILGNVPDNPIDEIFYERRGQPRVLTDQAGAPVTVRDLERIKIHQAAIEWSEDWFTLEAFYRKGHFHWGYEGDFFGLYPETYYGDAIDIYDADAPLGLTFTGKKDLDGLKIAFGPQLYWGANPALIAKYARTFGGLTLAVVHQEDIAQQSGGVSASSATPEQKTRKTTLYAETSVGPLKIELGAITAGSTKLGDRFLLAEETRGPSYLDSGYLIEQDTIAFADTLGAKAKLTYESGGLRWYLQGAYKGLVADGGADATVTFTGWRLKEDGRGNQWNVLGGAAFNLGYLQIAPNVLYQRPLTGPLPLIGDAYDVGTGVYYPGIRGRNILADPFVVRGNREQLAAELMLTWDPTPGTWLWAWDNEIVEDAGVALSLDFVYRHLPTPMDGGIGRLADGTPFGFPTSAPAHDLWEIAARAIFNPRFDLRIVANVYAGTGQANGDDARLIERFGADLQLVWSRLRLETSFKLNDWGPYDYHRDFNFTFPVQLHADLSWGLTAPKWLGLLYTRFGVRLAWRSLDAHSNRYEADPADPSALGDEWEVRSYFQVTL